jgi:hypothetical protein
MAGDLRVILEIGPKGKKVVATAWDWPGLERAGKTQDEALATLEAYLPRYAKVADRAGLGEEFRAESNLTVMERYGGNTSTDYWGISHVSCDLDRAAMPTEEWQRRLGLLQACWEEFDAVAARVSPQLQRGARGGGRDRDEIINHVFGTERTQMAKKVGVQTPQGVMLTPEGLRQHRQDYLDGLRAYHAAGRSVGRTWTLSFLLRRTAYHTLDHAWEMEDKDLSGQERGKAQ